MLLNQPILERSFVRELFNKIKQKYTRLYKIKLNIFKGNLMFKTVSYQSKNMFLSVS